MSTKPLSKEESLELITQMIGQAKRNFARGGSFYFLLWGWVVAICNLSHYILWKFELSDSPFMVWMLTIPAAVVSIIYGSRQSSRAKVKSHLDSLYSLIWLGIIIGAVITLYFSASGDTFNGIILIFSGLGTFLSGCALRFRPSILGGIVLWIAAIASFHVPIMEQYLIAAVGIILGYIIPGFLLRKAEKSNV